MTATLIRRNSRGWRIGQHHHRARYTDRDIELVQQLRAADMTLREIAAKMGMSLGYVCKVINGNLRG